MQLPLATYRASVAVNLPLMLGMSQKTLLVVSWVPKLPVAPAMAQ